jgi:HSP20 family molecular chaperone IbpA
MYTSNLQSLFDLFETQLPASYPSITDYDVKQLEDGKQQLTLSVLGHDVKNIKLEATEDTVTIKAKKEEGSYPLVEDISATFKVDKDYDGTKSEAKFFNGLLIVTIDKKDEIKSKSIQIKIGEVNFFSYL